MGPRLIPLLDTSALLGFLRDEPAAPEVLALFAESTVQTSAVALAELTDNLQRLVGLDQVEASDVVEGLLAGGMVSLPCDSATAQRAGAIRASNYHRTAHAVSLADCVILATAEQQGATLISSDANQCLVASRLGLAVHPIPNSSGVRPPG